MTERDDEDDLLAALGDLARDQDEAADALWQAVQEGPTEAPGVQPGALTPLDDGERADLTEALFGVEAAPAPVIDLASRRRGFIGAGVGLALAAGLAMVVFGRAASLPDYALEVRAGEQVLRGDEARSQVFSQGSVLSAVLRPEVDAAGAEVAVVLVPAGGSAQVLDLPVQVSASGAMRLRAVIGRDVPVGVGEHRLVFLVAPKGDLPSDPTSFADVAPSGAQRLQYIFRVSKRD